MGDSSIEWTDKTWNPTRGCRRISPGCERCYAETMAARFCGAGQPFDGLLQLGKQGPRWNGEGRFVPDKLDEPLHWRKPARVFVNSMSDLFFEEFSDEQIASVFGVMAACPHHTFQVLTKRPERVVRWFEWVERQAREVNAGRGMSTSAFCLAHSQRGAADPRLTQNLDYIFARPWPLPNVWIGVSVEDQRRADERLPLLLRIPAAVRFVSYEPALGPVDFKSWLRKPWRCDGCGVPAGGLPPRKCAYCGLVEAVEHAPPEPGIDWLIVGGESGPGARPFEMEWARSLVRLGREAQVPVFVKQMGARPWDRDAAGRLVVDIKNKKGGDMSEWPEELRVREFPEVRPC